MVANLVMSTFLARSDSSRNPPSRIGISGVLKSRTSLLPSPLICTPSLMISVFARVSKIQFGIAIQSCFLVSKAYVWGSEPRSKKAILTFTRA